VKKKCPICSKGKARRKCFRYDNQVICSKCCAEIRSDECFECEYYESNRNYNITKKVTEVILYIDDNLDDEIDKALMMLESGRIAKAKPRILELYKKHPDYYYTNFAMASLYLFEDDMDKGMEFTNKALDLHPALIEAYINKANIYKKRFDIANAISTFQIILELEKDSKNRKYYNLAKKEIDKLTPALEDLTPEKYAKYSALFKEAFKFLETKDFEKAKEYFLKSLMFKNNSEQAYGNLGLCCAALGQKDEAIKYLEKSLSIEPDYEPSIINLELVKATSEDDLKERFGAPEAKSIDYYKEYRASDKSLIKDFLKKLLPGK